MHALLSTCTCARARATVPPTHNDDWLHSRAARAGGRKCKGVKIHASHKANLESRGFTRSCIYVYTHIQAEGALLYLALRLSSVSRCCV